MLMKFELSGWVARRAKLEPPVTSVETADHKPLFMTSTPKSKDRCAKSESVVDVRYCVGVPPVACTYQRKIFCMKLVSMSPIDHAKFSDHAPAIGGIFCT